MYKLITLLAFTLIAGKTIAQVTYPDAALPTDTPSIFAKGLLSDGLSNRDFTISPKGDEIFFTLEQPRIVGSVILHLVKKNNQWGKPEVASFSGRDNDHEAAFSPDGQWIYFSSDRPLLDTGARKDFDIWRVKRTGNGTWGKPENLGPGVNTAKNEFYPSITRSGNLYITVEADYGKGDEDIVLFKATPTGYSKPESLPEDINTKYDEFNAFVDPDEQFILLSSYGRPDDMGRGDMYISQKDKAGNWLPVKRLPVPINTTTLDYCPFVTWDKKYLLFTSKRLNPQMLNKSGKTYEQIKVQLNESGNGSDDIYWVKFNPTW
ncbi:hypothetical protein [Mucilaginibacter sp. 22184]|uniref:hypothetical protein n=1 Tax=Mucilaginibacter sp. 22184 TaxID=3453887 RepID=UPI003F8684AB